MEQIYVVILLIGVLLQTKVAVGRYTKHLGCYNHNVISPELFLQIQMGEHGSPDSCARECTASGKPFSGIMQQDLCYCGMFYGKYGLSTACNYTCGTTDENFCGGPDTFDVFYAPDTDPVVRVQRQFIAHGTPKTFEQARKDCVQQDGDLAQVTALKQQALRDTAMTLDPVPSEIWIGLQRRIDDVPFIWSNPTADGVDASLTSSYWATSESFLQNCVVLVLNTLTFETRDCSLATAPYVCDQVPPNEQPGEEIIVEDDSVTLAPEEEDKGNMIMLWVVLPLFCIVYCGSCVIYAIGKTYKYFKRKRKEARTQEHMVEFEPDTKPMMNTGPTAPPPYYKLHSRARASTPRQPLLAEGPPVHEFGPQGGARMKSPPYTRSAPYVEPEKTDDENSIDFSKLSIQDIIYIKSLMGERRENKKKRKILVA